MGWQNSALSVSKVGISALTRIQHLELTADPREDIIINHVNPGTIPPHSTSNTIPNLYFQIQGYVDTDMTLHKGPMTVEEGRAPERILKILFLCIAFVFFFVPGAAAPSWLALLPPNVQEPNGAYVWHDKRIVDWVNGPLP